MKYMGHEIPILYHGTDWLGIYHILKDEKISPVSEQRRNALRKNSLFAKNDYNSLTKILEFPSWLITPDGGRRSIKNILEEEGINLTEENYFRLRPLLIDLEIEEGMRKITQSEDLMERYCHVWLTNEKSFAKDYAGDGLVLGFKIPKDIEEKAHHRYWGQIGFSCSIGLENLREVVYWNRNSNGLEKIKKDFSKWSPSFIEYSPR